jgi:hypothetical protein
VLKSFFLQQVGSIHGAGLTSPPPSGILRPVRLVYQPPVLFSQNKPATSQNQPAVLFSQNKPAPAISHQPTEQAAGPSRFTYLRRQILPHLQVVGVLLLQRLHQPALNRRFVRSPPGCKRLRRLCEPPPAASPSPSP